MKHKGHLEAINPNTGKIDDKRVWLVNNQIVFTDDGFKTTKSVLGEFEVDGTTYYGLLAQAVIAGLVEGSTIKGGTIQIGTTIKNGQEVPTFEVDANGNVTMNAAAISGYVSNETASGTYATKGQVSHYGVCNTEGSVADKVVECDVFELYKGASIVIKFAHSNAVTFPRLKIGDTTKYIVNEEGEGMSEDSPYNWSDNSTVTFVYDGQYWRIADSSTLKRTNTLSTQITQTAEEITLSVSQNYATLGQVAHYGTCTTAGTTVEKIVSCSGFKLYKGAYISVKFSYKNAAKGAQLNVNNTGAKNIAADTWTTMAENSAYNWDDNSTVTFTYDGSYWRISDSGALKRTSTLSSEIKQTADKIALVVKESSGSGSEFEVNSEAIRMAWNQSNDYIVFENGEIKMYTSSSHTTSNLFATYKNNGAWYYRSGTTLGRIGTNSWSEDTGYKGLVFDLEADAGYMCWAARDNASDENYDVKLIYHHKGSKDKRGLHFSCPTYADNNLYLTDDYRFTTIGDDWSSSGFDGAMKWGFVDSSNIFDTAVSINGWDKTLDVHDGTTCGFWKDSTCLFYNNSALDVYYNVAVNFRSNIDMNTYSILNQSDARLKTNIQDTQVSAIDLINQIEMKEFDWIESQEHEEIGIIAQQLQTIMPNLVHEDASTSKLSIKTTKFIPYLIKAIQEIVEYIQGDAALMSLSDKWIDPYTELEKNNFVDSLSSTIKQKDNEPTTFKTVEKAPMLIPIDTKGEEVNE